MFHCPEMLGLELAIKPQVPQALWEIRPCNLSLILRRSEVTRSHSQKSEREEGEEGVRASDLGPSENQASVTFDRYATAKL